MMNVSCKNQSGYIKKFYLEGSGGNLYSSLL